MSLKLIIPLIPFLFASSCASIGNHKKANSSVQHPPVKCMENSPERRGEEGCTVLANRILPKPPGNKLYWHIDRFDSPDTELKSTGINSVVTDAHGAYWVISLETKIENHHGAHHVTWIGPLVLPATDSIAFRIQSSLLMPGASTPAHTHPGPEVIFIVDGEQCMQTPEAGILLKAGQTYIVPGGVIHRGTVIGSKPRQALGFNLYDAEHPASHDLDKPPLLRSCK